MFNSSTFLDQYSDGIFLGSASAENLPTRDNRLEVRYALLDGSTGKEMIVIVDPYKLTPLGLSILFWMLPTTPDNRQLLKAIMDKMNLNNCFTKEVTEVEGTSKHTALVIPWDWALEFKVYEDFIVEHSVLGDFGICIGMMGSMRQRLLSRINRAGPSTVTEEVQPRQTETRHGPLSWIRGSEKIAELQIVQYDNDDDNQNDNENQTRGRLTYTVHDVDPKWVLKNVQLSFDVPFVGLGIEIGRAESNISLTNRGRSPPIPSLNNFVIRDMQAPYDNLYNRMKWLEGVLRKDGFFPIGKNRGFLEQMIEMMRDGDPIKLFTHSSCDVKSGALIMRNCQQLRNEKVHALLPMPEGSSFQFLGFSGETGFEDGREILRVNSKMEMNNDADELEDVSFDLW